MTMIWLTKVGGVRPVCDSRIGFFDNRGALRREEFVTASARRLRPLGEADGRGATAAYESWNPHLGRSSEPKIVHDHGVRPDWHFAGIRQIELTKHDLVVPDFAKEIFEDIDC